MLIRIYPKIPVKSKKYATGINKAKSWSECPKGHGGNKALHDRMAEIQRDILYKNADERMGRMAAQKNPNVIWKQWKKTKTKLRNLIRLGVPEYYARMAAGN